MARNNCGALAAFIGIERADADHLAASTDPINGAASQNGNINLLDALRLMQKALAVTTARRSVIPRRDAMSLEDMIRWLASQLQRVTGRCSFTLEEAFQAQSTPEHRAMLFLALLEMARGRTLLLDQEECFGTVRISTIHGSTS